jgi:hypothetical protein
MDDGPMVGGTDMSVHIADEAAALEAAVRRVRWTWPDAVIQGGDEERPFDSFAAVPFGCARELMVYRDLRAFRSWEALGADASNQNTMLHLLVADGALTIVADDLEHDPIAELVRDVRAAVTSGVPSLVEAEGGPGRAA